jgi:hypothetical protein
MGGSYLSSLRWAILSLPGAVSVTISTHNLTLRYLFLNGFNTNSTVSIPS